MRLPFGQRNRFGNHHVVKILHEGDKSIVFLAEEEGPGGTRVAIKLYKREYDELAARIEKNYNIPSEAEVGLRLNPPPGEEVQHYPLVRTLGQEREFGRRNGRRYLVLEHIEGVALKRLVTCRDARVARYPIAFVVQCCQALRIVHGAGFVYRDLCAQNLLVLPNHRLKLIDLGFAAPAGLAFPECSGTPSYMAPEQVRGEPLQPTADIYALGVLTYELLRARLPYRSAIEGDDLESIQARGAELMQMHLDQPVPELPERIRQHHPMLSEWAVRCMQKNPADRPQSVDDIIRAAAQKI